MAQNTSEAALGARGLDRLGSGLGRAEPNSDVHPAQDGHYGQDAPAQG